ncbi:hypothetical protein [Telmatospirillum siberiense]|uniref:Uncharacterized protein n=1 Tax=Telmatospirillum siberiense TaxID=382514 RepID=A0A2N3PSY3_9PROT|nr:hypothetical protein [Telmatospirillum siberiense]PKU23515.1 hypothetical protein CWS72_15705 [Telmatospirillum siberiense]
MIAKTIGAAILAPVSLAGTEFMRHIRRRLPLFAILCFILSLSACAGMRQPAGVRSTPQGPAETSLSPDGAPSVPGESQSRDDPAGLRGLAAADVTAKLGAPSFRRHETPAEVWQYFGPGCVLDLFLYEEKGTQRVAHAELRSRNLTANGQAACLAQLLEGRRGDADS